jgi:hypothetical protein
MRSFATVFVLSALLFACGEPAAPPPQDPNYGVRDFNVSPPDTAVYVGQSLVLRVDAIDSTGKHVQPPIINFVGGTRVSVAGPQVTGVLIGRDSVRVRIGTLERIVRLSVVPRGEVAFGMYGGSPYIIAFGLDGSQYRVLVSPPREVFKFLSPDWSPDSQNMVFQDDSRLYIRKPDGSVMRLVPAATGLSDETWPRYSRDGRWIYFAGMRHEQRARIWRVSVGGDLAEQVSDKADPWEISDLSPDGSRIVFSTRPPNDSISHLRILDLATDRVTDLGLTGVQPRWSPDGSRIAYWADSLYVINPSGTNRVALVPSGPGVPGGVTWSEDGKFVVYSAGGNPAVFELSTGQDMPLRFVSSLFNPTWRPGSAK